VQLAGELVHLQWDATQNCFYLRDKTGLEKSLRLRSYKMSQFSGEAHRSLSLELNSQGHDLIDRIELVATPFVPGSVFRKGSDDSGAATIRSPMVGKIIGVPVNEGDRVSKGQVIAVIEAMKMENKIKAPVAGTVSQLKARLGEQVGIGEKLCLVAPASQ